MNGEKAVFTPEMDAKRNGPSATEQGLRRFLSLSSNVLYLGMGHPLVMGHYFEILKSMKIDNHQPTFAMKNLISRGLRAL